MSTIKSCISEINHLTQKLKETQESPTTKLFARAAEKIIKNAKKCMNCGDIIGRNRFCDIACKLDYEKDNTNKFN